MKSKKCKLLSVPVAFAAAFFAAAGIGARVFAAAERPLPETGHSITEEQASVGEFVWNEEEGTYTLPVASGASLEVNSSLKGAAGWLDGEGRERGLNEISLYYKVRMHIVQYASNHTVPSLILAETDNTSSYIQCRTNGAMYLMEDTVSPYSQSVREFTGIVLSEGDSYLLEVYYEAGNVSAYIDGALKFENQPVNGDPVFKLCTYGAAARYSEIELKSFSDERSFVKTYPDPADGNENLLDLPGYENSVSPSGQTEVKGTTFSMLSAANRNFIVDNEYLSGLNFYRPDIREYSDGADMDFLVSADVAFGDYAASPQGWYGFGIIFGETSRGYLAVRLMNAGYAFIHDVDKSSGNTLYNVNYQGGSFSAKTGNKVSVSVYYVQGKLSVLIDGQAVLKKAEIKMTPKLGIHACNNKGKIENFSFKFIQPVKAEFATAKSEETAEFSFDRGKLDSSPVKTCISGDISSFGVNLSGTEDYFLMNSKASALTTLYRMTGSESYAEVENGSLTTLITADLKNIAFGEDGEVSLIFRHNASGFKRNQLSISADGTVKIQTATVTGASDLAVCTLSELPGTISLYLVSGAESVSVYMNGSLVFKDVEVPRFENIFGAGGENVGYTVENLSYKYLADVRFEKPEKETFPQKPPVGEANTGYIRPPLPEKLPVGGDSGATPSGGCKSAAVPVSLIPLAAVAVLIRKKKEW